MKVSHLIVNLIKVMKKTKCQKLTRYAQTRLVMLTLQTPMPIFHLMKSKNLAAQISVKSLAREPQDIL